MQLLANHLKKFDVFFYIVNQETVQFSLDPSSLFLHILFHIPTFDMPSMYVLIADFTFVCIKSCDDIFVV